MADVRIETERLVLRDWRDEDRGFLHRLGQNPETMRYLGPLRTAAEEDEGMARQQAFAARHGTCIWMVERRSDGAALGGCGVEPAPPGLPIAGKMEMGWRFAPEHWGRGYALEAARAALAHAWAVTDVEEVVAITVPANTSSRRLMERLGMNRVADGDFGHPFVPEDSPLHSHVLYRIARPIV